MESMIPEWITADFLKQSLQSNDQYKDIVITDFTVSLAAPAGNNYGSLVFRVPIDCIIKGVHQKLSVIVKGPVTAGAIGELFKSIKNSEPLFYNVFLPEVYKISEYRFVPSTFQSTIPSAVMMEDLKEAGYLMADRIKQLDFDHCRLYTDAAAAFHAASTALYRQNPEMIKSVLGDNFYSDESKAKPVAEHMNRWAVECMANHIPNKDISEIVKNSAKYMAHMLEEIHRPNDHLNSLLQCDPWTTNMMFKYDCDGKVCDIKLLDFQNLLYGSPVHDLVFFIWFSANDDVREHRLVDLYSHYFQQLNTNLRKFGCPELDFNIFMETIRMFSPLALATAATSAAILDSSPADFNEIVVKCMGSNPEAGSMLPGSNPMERYYTEHFCQNILPQMVDHLAAEGVFDYLEIKLKSMTDSH